MDPDDVTDVDFLRLLKSVMSFRPIVPILIFPLAVAEEVIDVIVLNLVLPVAIFDEVTPVTSSLIDAPVASVPFIVKVLPVSEAEQ